MRVEKRNIKPRRVIKSSTPRQNFYNYYKSKVYERKMALLKAKESEVESKKKFKHSNGTKHKARQTDNWLSLPLDDDLAIDSESSVDEEKEKETLNDISDIHMNELKNPGERDDSKSISNYSDFDYIEGDELSEDEEECLSSAESDLRFFNKTKEDKAHIIRPAAKKLKLSKGHKKGCLFPVKSKNTVICLLNHPASFSLSGYVSVEVLTGSVSILGHELNSESQKIRIYATQSTGLIECKTESYDHLWMRKEIFLGLSQKLKIATGSTQDSRLVLSQLGYTSVILVVTECVPPPHLDFLSLYYPEVLSFKLKESFMQRYFGKLIRPTDQIYPMCSETVQVSAEMEELGLSVNFSIQNSKVQESESPRLLIFGPRGSGKSTILRFLMNKVLSKFPEVYFLDADPGQTEFTPPGVISLTRVTKPVFGPPFCHQRKPLSMSFIGSITAGTSIDMYSKCVIRMFKLYQQHFSDQVLFVNTMGWIRGLGLECLKNVMQIVSPSVLVEVVMEDEETMIDFRKYVPENVEVHQIPCIVPHGKSNRLPAKQLRDLSLMSYFGKCQSRNKAPTLLNAIQPYSISWDKIPIYFSGKTIPPARLVECVNASVVALCRVHSSIILESNVPGIPKTLESDPDNECLGFGIVRAIDEEKHWLYIVTPLSLRELKGVNALIRGNIIIPDAVMLNQGIYNVPLPFTDERTNMVEYDSDDGESHSSCHLDADSWATSYRRPVGKNLPGSRTRRK